MGIRRPQSGLEDIHSPTAGTDEPETDAVVGPKGAMRWEHGRARDGCDTSAKLLDETTAIWHDCNPLRKNVPSSVWNYSSNLSNVTNSQTFNGLDIWVELLVPNKRYQPAIARIGFKIDF